MPQIKEKKMRRLKQFFFRTADSININLQNLLTGKNVYKYTLIGDCLYTREVITVQNTRLKISRKQAKSSVNEVIIKEDVYLLLLHEDNLAHFFHDIFFPLYVIWKKNNKKVFISINENQFIKDFLTSVFGPEQLIFGKKDLIYKFNKLSPTPEGRDLKKYSNYEAICVEIKYKCFSYYGINENRTKNLIYGRNELERKNLLMIEEDFLRVNEIQRVTLSTMSFKELITLLAQAKSLTYMVGAGVFYLLFLDAKVSVLEINPVKNNSWAQMFGMDKLCKFNIFISNNIKASNLPAQGDPMLDSHVYFDDAVTNKLLSILPK